MIQNLSACSPDTINSLSSCQENSVFSDYVNPSFVLATEACLTPLYEGEWSRQWEVWEGIKINWGEWLFNLGGEACG